MINLSVIVNSDCRQIVGFTMIMADGKKIEQYPVFDNK